MKGFIYFLEISIALILMIVVLGTIASFKSKENWERSDLIGAGENIVKVLKNEEVSEILKGNFSRIQSIIPPNVDFGLRIKGVPKANISVGCVDTTSYNYVNGLLTPVYTNNRWVNFSVDKFDINSLNYIPSSYDAVVLVNYTNYTTRKSNITDYLSKGGVLIGINATRNNSNADFNYFFGLSPASQGIGNLNFTPYDPSKDEIEKYFFAIGFDVNASTTISSSVRQGSWYIWEVPRKVNITNSNTIDVENKTVAEGLIQNKPKDSTFNLFGPDNLWYTFKVENISWSNNLTIIQPINTSLIFNKSFSEGNVTGNVNVLTLPTGQAGMASNGTAVWISDFNTSDEYKDLVKSAIISRVKDWYLKNPDLTKEYVSLSSFYPLCCDVPEDLELTIYLWYKI